jgi:hypothetical protein
LDLTTGFLLQPGQSTSAIVVHHPAAKYFVALTPCFELALAALSNPVRHQYQL